MIVVGSGAGGGMAAKILTEGGMNVALLEAGPDAHPEKDFKMFVWPYELAHRGIGVGGRQAEDFGEFLAPNGSWDIQGEPYTSAPGSDFHWFRSRIVGGRTNHWGRIALRFAPIDFRSYSRDGLGSDWPISYDDIAPYYDKVEGYIGVFGTHENVSSAPNGVFLPPPKPRCTENIVKKACDKLNITCIPSRLAILTKSVNGRLPCHYCGQCGRGCTTASNFSSSQVLIPPAMATGKLTMITGAMAREVLMGPDGKATGVSYIDKKTRTEQRINARAVVLAASACESARLLLNSKSKSFPDGLANSSGTVGRYLTDSVGSDGEGYFPQLENMTPHNHDGTGGMHMYMPWWKFDRQERFPARVSHRIWRRARDARTAECSIGMNHQEEGYGVDLKQRARKKLRDNDRLRRPRRDDSESRYVLRDRSERRGSSVAFRCLRFHFKWSEYELRQAKDMQEDVPLDCGNGGRHVSDEDADRWAERRTESLRAGKSSTKSARRAWEPIRRILC